MATFLNTPVRTTSPQTFGLSSPIMDPNFPVPDLSNSVEITDPDPVYSGPYSTVRKGRWVRPDGDVAIAIKIPQVITEEKLKMLRKIKREIQTWWTLKHPNILPLYGIVEGPDFGKHGALVSPWCSHGNAADYLKKNSLKAKERLRLWQGVADGIHYLHENNPSVIHADLKPNNIMIDDTGTPLVCDFGLVRFEGSGKTGMTTTTAHTGTAVYLARELVVDLSSPSTFSDVHALGCVGLSFLLRRRPHEQCKENLGLVYVSIANGRPPAEPPTKYEGALNDLWEFLRRCWDLTPHKRPSASDVSKFIIRRGDDIAEAIDSVLPPAETSQPLSPTSPQTTQITQTNLDSSLTQTNLDTSLISNWSTANHFALHSIETQTSSEDILHVPPRSPSAISEEESDLERRPLSNGSVLHNHVAQTIRQNIPETLPQIDEDEVDHSNNVQAAILYTDPAEIDHVYFDTHPTTLQEKQMTIDKVAEIPIIVLQPTSEAVYFDEEPASRRSSMGEQIIVDIGRPLSKPPLDPILEPSTEAQNDAQTDSPIAPSPAASDEEFVKEPVDRSEEAFQDVEGPIEEPAPAPVAVEAAKAVHEPLESLTEKTIGEFAEASDNIFDEERDEELATTPEMEIVSHAMLASPPGFKEDYKAYSISQRPLNHNIKEIAYSGKIILPSSAYEKLSQLGSNDTMEITEAHPWIFRMSNLDDRDLFVHAGVRDFQADEGCVILPDWMMKRLAINEGSLLSITTTSLDQGTFITLRPQGKYNVDRVQLEKTLRPALRNFPCLTQGATIPIKSEDGSTVFDLLVLEIITAGEDIPEGISLIEAQPEILLEPLGVPDHELEAKKEDHLETPAEASTKVEAKISPKVKHSENAAGLITSPIVEAMPAEVNEKMDEVDEALPRDVEEHSILEKPKQLITQPGAAQNLRDIAPDAYTMEKKGCSCCIC